MSLGAVVRGDYLLKAWSLSQATGATAMTGWLASACIGVAWAFAWYASTRWFAGRVIRRPG
jgi:hypothetical protein